ncbi:MAG: hypothetical protein QXH10_09790 [Ignisphaera sp.]
MNIIGRNIDYYTRSLPVGLLDSPTFLRRKCIKNIEVVILELLGSPETLHDKNEDAIKKPMIVKAPFNSFEGVSLITLQNSEVEIASVVNLPMLIQVIEKDKLTHELVKVVIKYVKRAYRMLMEW